MEKKSRKEFAHLDLSTVEDLLTASDLAEALVGLLAVRIAVSRALLDAHPREVHATHVERLGDGAPGEEGGLVAGREGHVVGYYEEIKEFRVLIQLLLNRNLDSIMDGTLK